MGAGGLRLVIEDPIDDAHSDAGVIGPHGRGYRSGTVGFGRTT
jgi:hypothetical protein